MRPADIVVYDRDDRVVAVVEIRASKKPTPGWATSLRWSGREEHERVVTTSDLLGSYLERIGSNTHDVAPEAMDLIVGIWLSDLTRNRMPGDQAGAPWLRESGLIEAVKDGRVEFQEAA